MKRFHVHVMVKDLENSIGFYRMLFGEAPTVIKDDYAKWMLDDPRGNFSLNSSCCGEPGLSHLGVQVENTEDLSDVSARLRDAGLETSEQNNITY